MRIGIANQRIVMRQIELPPILDPKELDSAVRFQAQDEIPMPIESVVLDYHPLGIVETDGGARMRVLLVAARRDMVERVLLAARQAGLRPEGVDLAAFGMIRALRPMDLPDDRPRPLPLDRRAHEPRDRDRVDVRVHARDHDRHRPDRRRGRRHAPACRSPMRAALVAPVSGQRRRAAPASRRSRRPTPSLPGPAGSPPDGGRRREHAEFARDRARRRHPPDRLRGSQLARLPPRRARRDARSRAPC